MIATHQLINQDSGNVEFYSPMFAIEAARRTMGGIDLDPFSSFAANQRVKADKYYDILIDGFRTDWFGRCWVNHPFGRDENPKAVAKMEFEYLSRRAEQICAITFAATSEKWFQPLLKRPQCFLSPRTNYYMPDGSLKRGVTKGSCVTYFGKTVEAFAREFRELGVIKIPYNV